MDYSQITDDLYIGTTPLTEDYELLRKIGVGLVINMRFERRPPPDLHNSPMPVLWLRTIDSPLIHIPLKALIRGVEAALETINIGKKVYVHCHAGVHRGVAMGAAILIARGSNPQSAMELIKTKRPAADPNAWYIKKQILRFAKKWDKPLEDQG